MNLVLLALLSGLSLILRILIVRVWTRLRETLRCALLGRVALLRRVVVLGLVALRLRLRLVLVILRLVTVSVSIPQSRWVRDSIE